MSEALEHLKTTCYQPALARITTANGTLLGTGCVVAPNRVLTCHHLFHGYGGQGTVCVQVNGISFEVDLGRDYQSVVAQDLGLLTVDLPKPISCVPLSTALNSHQSLFARGYTPEFPKGDAISLSYTAQVEGEGRSYLKFKDDRIISGFSGSPLLNEATGKVVGLIAETFGQAAVLGGTGIPVEIIWQCFPRLKKAHDAWHKAYTLWQEVQISLSFNHKADDVSERKYNEILKGDTLEELVVVLEEKLSWCLKDINEQKETLDSARERGQSARKIDKEDQELQELINKKRDLKKRLNRIYRQILQTGVENLNFTEELFQAKAYLKSPKNLFREHLSINIITGTEMCAQPLLTRRIIADNRRGKKPSAMLDLGKGYPENISDVLRDQFLIGIDESIPHKLYEHLQDHDLVLKIINAQKEEDKPKRLQQYLQDLSQIFLKEPFASGRRLKRRFHVFLLYTLEEDLVRGFNPQHILPESLEKYSRHFSIQKLNYDTLDDWYQTNSFPESLQVIEHDDYCHILPNQDDEFIGKAIQSICNVCQQAELISSILSHQDFSPYQPQPTANAII